MDNKQNIRVSFHFGATHATIENATPHNTIAELKATALTNLDIQPTAGVEYQVQYKGDTIANEGQTLAQLVGDHIPAAVQFHLKKLLTGGA